MFDRFTEDAKRTMNFARQATQRLGHDYLGTEHILFGLLDSGDPVTRQLFTSLAVDPANIRKDLEQLVRAGVIGVEPAPLPFTARAKRVLELAMDAARRLDDHHIGTEHLLLGLILEKDGLAGQALAHAGLTWKPVFDKVAEIAGRGDSESRVASGSKNEPGTAEPLALLRIAQGMLAKRGEADAARAVGAVIAQLEARR